jgi:rubrerythrin
MEFKSIHELLQFALSKEEASAQFYRDLAAQIAEPATQEVMESLAGQEEKHIQMITLEMNKQGYSVAADIPPDDIQFTWDERLELDDAVRNMNCTEALVLGIQKERAAFQLYAQLMGMAKNAQFRTMLMDLAEEEVRHILLLEQEYDVLTHKET